MPDTSTQKLRRSLRQTFMTRAALIALTFVTATASATGANAKILQAPGSRVSMDLPDNFKSSPLFAGFMEIISSAAVITLMLPPEAYDRVTAGFTAQALGKRGITDVQTGQLKRSDKHFYVTGEQKHPRAVFRKFILVIKDPGNTAVITFNVPTGAFTNASIKHEAVIKALTSAKLEAKAAPSRDLFKVGYLGPFKQTGAPTGTSRIYAETSDPSPKETRNIIAIAPSLNRLPIKSIKEFSQYAIKSLKSAKNLAVTSTKDLMIHHMAGHQITATATRGKADTPVVVRQLILLPAGGGYFRMLAVTKAADEKRLAPEIEKIFASFKATENPLAQ